MVVETVGAGIARDGLPLPEIPSVACQTKRHAWDRSGSLSVPYLPPVDCQSKPYAWDRPGRPSATILSHPVGQAQRQPASPRTAAGDHRHPPAETRQPVTGKAASSGMAANASDRGRASPGPAPRPRCARSAAVACDRTRRTGNRPRASSRLLGAAGGEQRQGWRDRGGRRQGWRGRRRAAAQDGRERRMKAAGPRAARPGPRLRRSGAGRPPSPCGLHPAVAAMTALRLRSRSSPRAIRGSPVRRRRQGSGP
jgi:hypothetical protein